MGSRLEVIMKGVDEITPYWRNPRRNEKTVAALCRAIEQFGFNVPIVIDENGVIVKGHARLKAAKRLGMDEVPCIVSHEDEDTIKADRIADNKIQELSGWDIQKLEAEYERIADSKFERLFFQPEIQIPPYVPPTPQPYVNSANIVQGETVGEGYGATGEPQAMGEGGTNTGIWETPKSSLPGENRGFDSPYAPVKKPENTGDGPKTVKAVCPHCGEVIYVKC